MLPTVCYNRFSRLSDLMQNSEIYLCRSTKAGGICLLSPQVRNFYHERNVGQVAQLETLEQKMALLFLSLLDFGLTRFVSPLNLSLDDSPVLTGQSMTGAGLVKTTLTPYVSCGGTSPAAC